MNRPVKCSNCGKFYFEVNEKCPHCGKTQGPEMPEMPDIFKDLFNPKN